MKHCGSIVLCFALLTVIGGTPAFAQEEAAAVELTGLTSPEELEAFLDGVFAAQLPAHKLASATVSVVKDGELFFAKGYGYADREQKIPVAADTTLFRPGSISKLFTWTAVMQLVEQGKIDLDADVNSYLTTFQIPDTYPEPITMTDLLTHTPGFEDAGLGLFARDASDLKPLRESLTTYMPARVRPPFTMSSYSNYGSALAGLIVEELTGMEFTEYVEKNIFEPLGMADSSFLEPLPDHLAGNMAIGYERANGLFEPKGFEFIGNFGPAGSLSSTATDMAKFMIAHLQDGRFGDIRILEEDTARKMHSRLYELDPRLPGMAHGFYESEIRGHHAIGHGGDTIRFHSDLFLFPEFNTGLYVSYVTGGGLARMELIDAFVKRYFPDRMVQPAAPPDGFEERAKKVAGSYRFTRHNYSSIEKVAAMISAVKVSPGPDGTVILSTPFGDPWHWVEVEPYFYQHVESDWKLTFREDNGAITHAFISILPFMPLYRLTWYDTPVFNGALLILGVVFFISTLISAFRHRKTCREDPAGARAAMRLGVAVSALSLLFLVCFAVVLVVTGEEIMYGIPFGITAALVLPVVTSLLTIAVAFFAVRLWANGWWTVFRRIHYSVFTILAIGWVWFYFYWNLLGWQY